MVVVAVIATRAATRREKDTGRLCGCRKTRGNVGYQDRRVKEGEEGRGGGGYLARW